MEERGQEGDGNGNWERQGYWRQKIEENRRARGRRRETEKVAKTYQGHKQKGPRTKIRKAQGARTDLGLWS
jgi:hypothetical protein